MTGAAGSEVEVLVVGAGPTGLTMAGQLARHMAWRAAEDRMGG
ncbi:hypothetical protein [Micromonospora sp. NPDC004551]